MLDIKKIRADFDGVAAKLATRGVEKEKLEKLHDLDIKRRELIVKSEALKAERNSVSDEISQVKRAFPDYRPLPQAASPDTRAGIPKTEQMSELRRQNPAASA